MTDHSHNFPSSALATDLFPTGRINPNTTPNQLLSIGTTIRDRYQIKKVLGYGGMGVVYLVFDPLRNRNLAMKCLHDSNESHTQKQLAQELAVYEQLYSTHIVRTYDLDIDSASGQMFFTMEYIQGHSLAHYLTEAKHKGIFPPFSKERVYELFQQLTDALAQLHEKGIIHRDIKPNNIMLTDSGDIKLLDFGIAKVLHTETTTNSRLTGTLQYIPPEAFDGTKLTVAADIYALGMLLYQCITGASSLYGRLPAPSEWLAEKGHAQAFSKALDKVVLKAIDNFPHKRHKDMKAFQEALQNALQDNPTQTRIATQPTENSHFVDKSATFKSEQSSSLQSLRLFEKESQRLDLSDHQVEIDALIYLQQFPQLKSLMLQETGLSDNKLVYLASLPTLQTLHLSGNPFNGSGLRHLKSLRVLKSLALGEVTLEPKAWSAIAALPALEWLSLWGSNVDDKALKEIAKHRNIRILQLSETQITGKSLSTLGQMTQLKELTVWQTALTAEEVRQLRTALPRCKVSGPS